MCTIREKNSSPTCQAPSNVSICLTQVGYDDELHSCRYPDQDNEHADELPWDGFWQFVQKFFGYANRLLQQLSGWLVSDDLGGEDAGCGGSGLGWAGWMYCQILWNFFGYKEVNVEMNIQFTGNSSGGHYCSQHANCMALPQNLRHLWHCAVW